MLPCCWTLGLNFHTTFTTRDAYGLFSGPDPGIIPHHDFLRAMKWELLKRHYRPISNDVNGFDSSMDSFTIKLGKGMEFQSLNACARVPCCTSLQELSDLAKEAAEHDGRLARRPLTKSSREIKANQMLL